MLTEFNINTTQNITNFSKQTPLIRLVLNTESFENDMFMELLEILSDTVTCIDSNKKNVLHYIVEMGISHITCSRYYMKLFFEWFNSTLDEIEFEETEEWSTDMIYQVLDQQDINGDTPLHLSVKIGDPVIINLLLDLNSRIEIQNNEKNTVFDLYKEKSKLDFTQATSEMLMKIQGLMNEAIENATIQSRYFSNIMNICKTETKIVANEIEIVKNEFTNIVSEHDVYGELRDRILELEQKYSC